MTTAENLNRIIQAKADIKKAIENKGVAVGNGTIDTYAEKINEIQYSKGLNKMFYNISVGDNINLNYWDYVEGEEDMTQMFFNSSIKKLSAKNWKVSALKNCSYMFDRCTSLTEVSIVGWVTPSLEKMTGMFRDCISLTTINGIEDIDVTNVKGVSFLFENCAVSGSLDLSGWNINKITDLYSTFNHCENLTSIDLTGWGINKVTDMQTAFRNCTNLTEIKGIEDWDVSNVTHFYQTFQGCENLILPDLSNWKPKNKITHLICMFDGCQQIESLDLSGWNTSEVEQFWDIFFNCKKLKNLNITGWDFSKETYRNGNTPFYGCYSLTNLQFGKNLKVSTSFSHSTQLTVDSLLSIINGLYDFTGNGVTPTSLQGVLTLGSENLSKLSSNQKAIATRKGWVLN